MRIDSCYDYPELGGALPAYFVRGAVYPLPFPEYSEKALQVLEALRPLIEWTDLAEEPADSELWGTAPTKLLKE
jgi:hypothetical protein